MHLQCKSKNHQVLARNFSKSSPWQTEYLNFNSTDFWYYSSIVLHHVFHLWQTNVASYGESSQLAVRMGLVYQS